ncbi:4718_t:CDS:2 [Diversispora eburnea]|uniref:4718_t:CDS:1 n=1 Tax=Diversispora eburnea TaxID=1213867 RepID=A0A9N8YLU0_9GLOM|nr:4718_t:CDS:2 [Diversispora eburnea]
MNRRRVGYAGLSRKKAADGQFSKVGSNYEKKQMEQVNIEKEPKLRTHFSKICANVGVDPLLSNKGFWAELLGYGNFYYDICVQIIEICRSTRDRNGGLVELGELKRQLTKKRSSSQEISEDDIVRAIKTLKPLGNGFEIIQIGNRKMVRSVPRELNIDQSNKGYVTKYIIESELGWGMERINDVIDTLLADGLCWIDEQADPIEYWVPSFFKGVDD